MGAWQDIAALPRPGPKDVSTYEDTNAEKESERRFGLEVPGLGRVSGYAEAYKDLLTGKSDEIGRSYGFFVYVFGPGAPSFAFFAKGGIPRTHTSKCLGVLLGLPRLTAG